MGAVIFIYKPLMSVPSRLRDEGEGTEGRHGADVGPLG